MAENHTGEGALDQYWAFLKETYRKKYSEVAADHMVFPRNSGEPPDHSSFGIIYDDHNQTMAMWLKIENDRVTGASFVCDDCITCTACASALTEMARGKTTSEVRAITVEDLIENLQGLPEEDHHCAKLAIDTVRASVNDFLGN
jgi:nitrogen fixation NifU-like protein